MLSTSKLLAVIAFISTFALVQCFRLFNLPVLSSRHRFYGMTETAELLKSSVQFYLDKEFSVSNLNKKVSDEVKNIYLNNCDDDSTASEVLRTIGTQLESFNLDRTMANAWDIAQCCVDILQQENILDKIGKPLRQRLRDSWFKKNNISTDEIQHKMTEYFSCLEANLERLVFLRQIVTGSMNWKEIHYPLALSLGFRLNINYPYNTKNEQQLIQWEHLAPLDWGGMTFVPDFSDYNDAELVQRMKADIPRQPKAEDDGNGDSIDALMEVLMGTDPYATALHEQDPDTMQRMLAAQWLYMHGFLNIEQYPLKDRRFVPVHKQEVVDNANNFDE